jgi:hypothetical protein
MSDLFAQPRTVSSIDDCYFYHSMDIPHHGVVAGEWDLRGREREYLGGLDVSGKSVLEIGTASGYLCFWMEKQGARMAAYDLSERQEWDIVPYATADVGQIVQGRRTHIRMVNNSWWFAHERLNSNARMAYGTAYEVSDRLGRFDIVTLSCILLHLRDPFLAIQRAVNAASNTIVITDVRPVSHDGAMAVLNHGRVVRFLPNARAEEPLETWWQLSPEFVAEALRVLGFGDISISYHQQHCKGNEISLFTIVAHKASLQSGQDRQTIEPRGTDSYRLHSEIMEKIPGRHLLRHLAMRVWEKVR